MRRVMVSAVTMSVVGATLGIGLVPGHAAPSQSTVEVSATAPPVRAAAHRPEWGHAMGVAGLNGHPLRRGRVRVLTTSGRPLTVRGPVRRTGRAGVFHVRVRDLPRFFVVEVRGGRFGSKHMAGKRLRAIGSARERGEVVNEASTIAANHLLNNPRAARRHPKAAAHRATRHTARFLGLHRPRHLFSLGLAARTVSVAYDPQRVFRQARRSGFNSSMRHWARQVGNSRTRHSFTPRHYEVVPLGAQRRSQGKGGPAPACVGVTECLLVVLKNTAVSLVGSAAHAGVCQLNGGSPLVASLTGCGTDAELARILNLLDAMNEQLTNMEQQLTTILTMLADQAQTTAYNTSDLPQLEGVIESWLLDMLELSDPAVDVQPLAPIPATSPADEICAAAYTSSGQVPAPYQGYAFTQTPYQACLNAGANTGEFIGPSSDGSWATSIFQALTGYGAGFPPDDLLAPTYQDSLSNGGTQLITGTAQNTLNQLLSSFIGLQATAFQLTQTWQTFAYAWTDQPVTCPQTPLPTSFADPAAQPLTMTGPCATAVTALFELSLEAYIAQNLGPRAQLPAPVILDTYNAVGAADVPVWWSQAVDISGKTMADNPDYYPYFIANSYRPDYVPWDESPVANPTTPVPIITNSSDTFTFGNPGQVTGLARDALNATKNTDIDNALADVGFAGPGVWWIMNWSNLGTTVDSWAFTPGKSCSGWPSQGPIYLCVPGAAPYQNGNFPFGTEQGAGVLGTYAAAYVTVGSNNAVSLKNCQSSVATWNVPPHPSPAEAANVLPGVAQLCIAGSNQNPNGDPGYYGLLIDTTAGDVLWSDGIYQQWQNQSVPVIPSDATDPVQVR